MTKIKSLKFYNYLIYFFLIIFLFFCFSFKNSFKVKAADDLPINTLLTDCFPNSNSTPTNCINSSPALYIDISWNAVSSFLCGGACYYNVIRNDLLARSNLIQTTWPDKGEGIEDGLKDFTEYTYKIQALKDDGTIVAETVTPKSITTKACSCPNPFPLISSSNDCQNEAAFINLSWSRVLAGPIEATSYGIYRWPGYTPEDNYNVDPVGIVSPTSPNNSWSFDGTNYTYHDSSVIALVPYTYKVVAYSSGPGRASGNYKVQAAGPCPKPAITGLVSNDPACSPQGRITVKWEDCANSSNPTLCKSSRSSYYSVFKNGQENIINKNNNCFCEGVIKPCCVWGNNRYSCCWDDSTNILNGINYSYAVKTSGSYWDLFSDTQSKTVNCDTQAIPAPDTISAYPLCDQNNSKILLNWSYSGGTPSGIVFYYIYKYKCGSTEASSCEQVSVAGGSPEYRQTRDQFYYDSNIQKGIYYKYYVRAVTNSAIGDPSDTVKLKSLDCSQIYPSLLKPALSVANRCYNLLPRMTLTWLPLKTETDGIYIYYIKRNNQMIFGVTSNSYNDDNVTAGQNYTYIIETIGQGGWVDSDPVTKTAKTTCDKPGLFSLSKPTSTCSGGKYTINVAWGVSENATHYDVFEKLNNNTPPVNCADSTGLIGTVTSSQSLQFTHSDITQEGNYYYFVRARISGPGGSSTFCTFASYASGNNSILLTSAAPPKPATPQASSDCNVITLTWPPVNGATGYSIYYHIGGGAPTPSDPSLNAGTNLSYPHSVNPDTVYRYSVVAKGICADSPLSDPTDNISAPYCQPGSFSVSGTGSCSGDNNPAYTIFWTQPDPTVFRYDIYRNSNNIDNKTASPFGPDHPGQGTFTYYVKAVNPGGETQSINSFVGNLDCSPPGAINDLAANPNVNCVSGFPVIKLSWTKPIGAYYYNIYRCKGCSDSELKTSAKIIATSVVGISYRDIGRAGTPPITGHTYRYQVETHKAANPSTSWSNIVEATARTCPVPSSFGASLDTSCQANNKPTFTITWNPPAPAASISSYKIYRVNFKTSSYNDFSSSVFASPDKNDTSWSDSSVDNNKWYSYYIKTTATDGQISDSNIVNGEDDCSLDIGSVNLYQANALCDATNKLYVDLAWSLDDDTHVSYYKVYRKGEVIKNINYPSQKYDQDFNVSADQHYTYQIQACASNNFCVSSNNKTNDPDPMHYCLPGAPTLSQPTTKCLGDSPSVILSWSNTKGAASYKILRDNNGDGIPETLAYNNVNSTTQEDANLSRETNYKYQIIAVNNDFLCSSNICDPETAGNCASQCSNVGSITTLGCMIDGPDLQFKRHCSNDPGNNYGTYTHLFWSADEVSLGPPLWCRLDKYDPETDTFATTTPTFYSHAIVNYPDPDHAALDNIAYQEANNIVDYNQYFPSTTLYKSSPAVGLNVSGFSCPYDCLPAYVEIQPGAFPAADRDISFDLWFNIAGCTSPASCGTPTVCGSANFRSLLTKDGGSGNIDFRLAYRGSNQKLFLSDTPIKRDIQSADYQTLVHLVDGSPYLVGCANTNNNWHHLIFSQYQQTKIYLDKELVYEGDLWGKAFNRSQNFYLGALPFSKYADIPDINKYVETPGPIFDEIRIWPDKIYSQHQVDKWYDTIASAFTESYLKGATKISLGGDHSCAIIGNDVIRCWGEGKEAGGAGTGGDTPQSVLIIRNAQDISAGKYYGRHSCAINGDHNAYCWGNNDFGQIGNGTAGYDNPADQTKPDPVAVIMGNVSSISAGYKHTCAVANDVNKTVWCWGYNQFSQLGGYNQFGDGTPGSSGSHNSTPIQVQGGLTDVKQVAAGIYHTCAIKNPADSSVWCWGNGPFLGRGSGIPDTITPLPVQLASGGNLTGITQISIGQAHTCALKNDGTVWCWGGNDFGQIGNGTTTPTSLKAIQVQVSSTPTYLSNITAIASGDNHNCAIKNDGTSSLWCWGSNVFGQLGLGDTTNRARAKQVKKTVAVNDYFLNVSQVSAGTNHTCAILNDTDKTVWCWGSNKLTYAPNTYIGQLGNNNAAYMIQATTTPIEVLDTSSSYIKDYDDFDSLIAGDYRYRAVCHYSNGQNKFDGKTFTITACTPDISLPADGSDLTQICSDFQDKEAETAYSIIADCSAGYSPDNENLQSEYQPQVPYALLAWDHLGGADSFDVYKYDEGQATTTAILLGSIKVAEACNNEHCHCKNKGAGEKDASGNYKKYHYFIRATGPGGTAERDFPSSVAPASATGYKLSCLSLPSYQFYLRNSCDNSPGVDLYLQTIVPSNITSYWDGTSGGDSENPSLRLAGVGGNDEIVADGVTLASSLGIADDRGGATQLASGSVNSWGTVSWDAKYNISNYSLAPLAISMWVKLGSASAQSQKEIFFYTLDPADIWAAGKGGEPESYLRLARAGTLISDPNSGETDADEKELEIASRSDETFNSSKYYTNFFLSDTSWHHLRGVWYKDGVNSKMKLWVDFKLVGESSAYGFPAVSDQRIYLGDHYKNKNTVINYKNSITAKATVDEVYITKDVSGNDPIYYEVFRKGPADTEYKYVVTLDSNAFLWAENTFSNNLTAGGEYSYKIRVNSTSDNYTPVIINPLGQGPNGENKVKLDTNCDLPTGPGPFGLDIAQPIPCTDSGEPKVELVWYDTKKPTEPDNDYKIEVYRKGLQPNQQIFYTYSLPPSQSPPDADGNYCTTQGIEVEGAAVECHFYYTASNMAKYNFQVFRNLESDEDGDQVLYDYLNNFVTPNECYTQAPTPLPIIILQSCCSNGAVCVIPPDSTSIYPAVSITWTDSDYTNKYVVYRDCLSSDIKDCPAGNLVGKVYDTDICFGGLNDGKNCLKDDDCPGGTCGLPDHQVLDFAIGFNETHSYKVFAIGKEITADNTLPPDNVITTPSSGIGGCAVTPTKPEIISVKRSCQNGNIPAHEITWEFADSYGTCTTDHESHCTTDAECSSGGFCYKGDPNHNIHISSWLIYYRQSGGDFNYLTTLFPPPSSSNYPFLTSYSGLLTLGANSTYNYKIYAISSDGINSAGSSVWNNPNHPGEDVIAPICSEPPAKDLVNLRIIDYSQCNKITFKFDINSLSTPPDDFAEGYEAYRLTTKPNITNKYYYCNCEYDANELLKCEYDPPTTCPIDEVYHKNKKLNDQSAVLPIVNIQSRNARDYTLEDSSFTPGQTYYWGVVSYNSRGYSASTESNVFGYTANGFATKECAQAPEKTTVTAASKCPDSVILTWPNPTTGEAVTHYNIYRRKLEGSDFKLVNTGGPLLACDHEGCLNSYEDVPGSLTEVYKYRIVSVSQQQIEGNTFYIEGNFVEKNARACFRLPRWQELPGDNTIR